VWLRIETLTPLGLVQNVVDVAIVAYLFYRILLLIRNTRAFQLVKGVVALLVATQASALLGLNTLHVVLQTFQVALLVALPVVFQPELRRALEQLGRTRLLPQAGGKADGDEGVVREVVRATVRLARDRIGALIALEQGTGLDDVVETGTPLDARLSWELLVNIFTPNTPLHDGAVVVVVSEETGVISLAEGGRLLRHLDEASLRRELRSASARREAHILGRRARLG
jgi:diadenylate cyclase